MQSSVQSAALILSKNHIHKIDCKLPICAIQADAHVIGHEFCKVSGHVVYLISLHRTGRTRLHRDYECKRCELVPITRWYSIINFDSAQSAGTQQWKNRYDEAVSLCVFHLRYDF